MCQDTVPYLISGGRGPHVVVRHFLEALDLSLRAPFIKVNNQFNLPVTSKIADNPRKWRATFRKYSVTPVTMVEIAKSLCHGGALRLT